VTQRLEIRNLAVAYGRTAVVHGIDLHVQAGEMVALLGANGAGKTSILRAISHQQVTAKGTLRFEGQDIIDMARPPSPRWASPTCPKGAAPLAT
jgi:branched-chain amino acid transport system ATP-binding protein